VHAIFVFAKFGWSIHFKVIRLDKHTHNNQKNHSHTTSAVSRQVSVHVLAGSASIKCIFSTYGPTSETVWMERRQKYPDFTELKKITSRVYSNCSNYSVFQVLQNRLLFIKSGFVPKWHMALATATWG